MLTCWFVSQNAESVACAAGSQLGTVPLYLMPCHAPGSCHTLQNPVLLAQALGLCCLTHCLVRAVSLTTRPPTQPTHFTQMAFLSLLSLVQSLVVWLGLAAGLVFCIWGSSRGTVSVGDTVLFISMMQQLYVPLTFFGSYYRQVSSSGLCCVR